MPAPTFQDPFKKKQKVTYWAVEEPLKCISEIDVRRAQYYQWLGTNGRRTMMRRCWIFYNMAAVLSASIVQAGDKGQYAMLYVNKFRKLLNQLFQTVINNRPAWEPKSMSNDSKALMECRLARTTLDYYMRAKNLDKLLYKAVEFAGCLGEGFVECTWDAYGGNQLEKGTKAWLDMAIKSGYDGTPQKEPKNLREGDLAFAVYSGIDVIRDPNAQNWEECDWFITRKFVNKYDLAARYPEKKDAIERMSDMSANIPLEQYRNYFKLPYKSDRVILYTFWHKKTAACPEGRELRYMSTDLILEDKPLGYSEIPVFRIAPGEMDGTSNGYTPAFDLCGPQEMMNNLNSTMTSLIKAYGIYSVFVPVGTRANEARLPEGFNLIETVGATKFEPVNWLDIKPELFNYLKMIIEMMEDIVGINKPNPNASGSAQALQASQSQQFNQFFQSAYEFAFENLGTQIIQQIKQYATAPRMIEINGDNNKTYLQEISKDNFSKITKVVADVSDPMSKTQEGRFQKAQLYVQGGQANNVELFSILETGKLIGFDLGETTEITVQAENEMLSRGITFPVVPTDDDVEHLRLHGQKFADTFSTPEARLEAAKPNSDLSKVYDAFTKHIQMHEASQGVQGQPGQPMPFTNLKAAMGQQPPPGQGQPAGPGSPPPGGAQPGPAPGNPPPKGQGVPAKKPAQPPGRPNGAAPSLPGLPTTPGGKEQFIPGTPPPPTGG